MANNITLAKTYVPLLDEVYKNASLSSVLDSNTDMIKQAENGKDFLIPKIDMSGLADDTRGGEYVGGDVTFSWQTKTPDYTRNRMFTVDTLDNIETAGLAFGRLSGEFIRTKVVPEIDAVRFARYATRAITAGNTASLALTSKDLLFKALKDAKTHMDEAEVPEEGRVLFITPTLYNEFISLETIESKEILNSFSEVVKVPQTRFYTAVTLKDGKTTGQTEGGYAKGSSALDINFLIIVKGSNIQALKHVAPKIISPEDNQTGDNWKFGYRVYGIHETLDNKLKAIYVHTKPSA